MNANAMRPATTINSQLLSIGMGATVIANRRAMGKESLGRNLPRYYT
jgi:hypothetical protein